VKKNKFLSLESVVPDYQGIERIAVIKKYNYRTTINKRNYTLDKAIYRR